MAASANQPDWDAVPLSRAVFADLVRKGGAVYYRELPWRNLDDPYAVLVSEVMLQQTQVSRVLDFWPRFMALFPTVDALAAAGTADVLEVWQGLGYNRRALALKKACNMCSAERGGRLPESFGELLALPGVGPATAAGVLAFAYNRKSIYIETNVRSVFLHLLFPDQECVSDRVLEPYVEDSCPADNARAWYYALLDYGAHLKAQGINPSRRSAHYARQSAFAGSRREKRSVILKSVLASQDGIAGEEVACTLNDYERAHGRDAVDPVLFASLVDELAAEGFFREHAGLLIP